MARQTVIVVYGIISVFVIAILVQLNSYLSIVSISQETISTSDNTKTTIITPHERKHQKDFRTLITYIFFLSATLLSLLIHSRMQQSRYKRAKLLGQSITRIHRKKQYTRWLLHEWRLFRSMTFSCLDLINLSLLFAVNGLILFWHTNATASGTAVSEDGNLEDPHLYLRSFANGSAELAVANIAFAVLLSAKISILQRYFFSFDQTIRWHAWFGRLGFLEALYHATFQIQYKSSRQWSLFDTLMYSTRYKTGTCLFIAMLCFVLGSHPLIRFISYRFFRIIHLASFAALVLLGCWHHWSFYVFYMAVLLFWVTNQLDRSYETQSCSLEALPANIVRVRCDVSRYNPAIIQPGQFAFLYFQSSSAWKAAFMSHPFSISRVDHDTASCRLTFYIRATGKRTKSLYAMAEQQSQDKMMKIRVSRPLGRPFVTNAGAEFGDFETVVLVAEGMGITPWIAVLQYIEQKEHAIKTRSVHLIWSVHGIDTFYAFEQEFDHFVTSVQLELSIEVYVTGPSDPEESYSIPNNLTCIQFTASCRPNYKQLFKSIHQGRPEEDSSVALGVCAHEETLVKASNLALDLSWDIRKERFEL